MAMIQQEADKLARFGTLVRDVQIKLLSACTFGLEDSTASVLPRVDVLRKKMGQFEEQMAVAGKGLMSAEELRDGWQALRATLAETCRLALAELEKPQ